jgi:glycosyltransferase involved in cell wall biosynthesis
VIYVLHLTPLPPGIDFRAWAVEIEGFRLLRWLLLRITQRISASSVLVMAQSRLDRDLACDCAAGTGVAVFQSPAESKLEAIADIAAAFPRHDVAWFCPEIALAPSDLLERVASYHRSTANHYTRTRGLPELVGCEIADSGLLAAIGGLPYKADAPDPSNVFAELVKRRRGVPDSEQIRAAPFNVPEHYGSAADFPEILIATRNDADRARRCLVNLPRDYGLEPLRQWTSGRVSTYLPTFSDGASAHGWPRILYVSPYSAYSGAEECLVGLARGLGPFGYAQFALIGFEGLLAARLRDAGASVACPNWDLQTNTEHSEELAAHVLGTVRPDLIHCNTPPGLALLRGARSLGIPVVTHVRVATLDGLTEVLAESTRVIAVSRFVEQRLIAVGVPLNRINRVYDGVDSEHFCPGTDDKAAIRARFGIPQKAFMVLMIARLSASKRHDLVIEAAARAIPSVSSLFIVFVDRHGDQHLRRQIIHHAAARGLCERILWLPFQEQIRDIEVAADVLVLCSDDEALGTCVLEAMSLEKPVIVADSGGIAEVVEDGICGIVTPAGSADALAQALARLAIDREWARTLGHTARKRILSRFTLRHYAEQVAKIFQAVVNLKR